MPIISGTLRDGAGMPVNDCVIQLKALNTTNVVIIATTASIGAQAGEYRIDAQPGQYEVSLLIRGWPPKTVGTINVYADSADATLNDFLNGVKEEYLRPEPLKRFEQLAQRALASADVAQAASQGISGIKEAADKAASDALSSAQGAGEAALAAKKSETRAADSAGTAAASEKAAALHEQAGSEHEKNAGKSAEDAALNATNAAGAARNAGESATDASGHATEALAQAENAGTHAERAQQAALDAGLAAKNAAADAVAAAVPEAARQIKTEIADDVSRAESAVAAAELHAKDAADSEIAAARALKDAQDIAKTPGPSAYDVWVSQQPVGADTSMTAWLAYQKGGDPVTPEPGCPGSLVLGVAEGGPGFGYILPGNCIKPAALTDITQGQTPRVLTEDITLTGTWRVLGGFLGEGQQLTLFQRFY